MYAIETIYPCDAGNQGMQYCGAVNNAKTRIPSVGNGLMNLGFFDGHAKAVKGKKAIADDMFGLYTNYQTAASGWTSKSDVLRRMNAFTEWQ